MFSINHKRNMAPPANQLQNIVALDKLKQFHKKYLNIVGYDFINSNFKIKLHTITNTAISLLYTISTCVNIFLNPTLNNCARLLIVVSIAVQLQYKAAQVLMHPKDFLLCYQRIYDLHLEHGKHLTSAIATQKQV